MRECQKRASKKWDASNNDKIREYKRNYYHRNKERIAKHYQENKIDIKIMRINREILKDKKNEKGGNITSNL